jgi:PAS domain S-box-containing protein
MSIKNMSLTKKTPYIVFVAGLVVSVIAYLVASHVQSQKRDIHLESEVKQISTKIKDRMESYEQMLLSGAAFFYASNNSVNRDDWRIFVEKQKVEANFPGIQGVGYAEVVRPKDLKVHTQKIQAQGFPDYAIRPEGSRDLYTPVTYLEPFNERNKRAFGYDMNSESVRKEALTRAINIGGTALSGKVRLKQENTVDEQAGFLMYVPVFKKGAALGSKEERMAAIQGFVYAPFRAKDLTVGILGYDSDRVGFRLYDGSKADPKQLMYDSHPKCQKEVVMSQRVVTVDINGRTWTFEFKAHKEYFAEIDSFLPLIALACGIVISSLICILLLAFVRTEEKALTLADEMTEELKEAKERWEFAITGSGDGVWEWNLKTDEVLFDKRWKEMLGFAEHEIQGSLGEWENRVHPDCLLKVHKDLKDYFDGKTESYKNEHRVKCKDGSYKWVLDRGIITRRDSEGKPEMMVGTHSDINERKMTEQSLKDERNFVDTVFDTACVVMTVIDRNGSVMRFNKYAEEFTGYTLFEIQEPMFWKNFLKPEQRAGVDELFENAKQGKIKNRYENYWISRNGEAKLFDWSNSIINDAKGQMTHLVAIGIDITKQKEDEQSLKELNETLEQKVQVKIDELLENEKLLIQQSKMAMMGEMIGAIAHQWRQPLNSLGLTIQDIVYAYKYGELDEAYLEKFKNEAMNTVQQMSRTIEDFRNFFSPNKKAEQFFVEDAIAETLKILESQLRVHSVAVLFDQNTTTKHSYVCFKNELQQVLLNILANAKDALLEKEQKDAFVKIDINGTDDALVITIEDSAGGIPEDIIDKVFDSHFTTKDESKGTGIGLYMSKEIVEGHLNGNLSVTNSANGAVFMIRLPLTI